MSTPEISADENISVTVLCFAMNAHNKVQVEVSKGPIFSLSSLILLP